MPHQPVHKQAKEERGRLSFSPSWNILGPFQIGTRGKIRTGLFIYVSALPRSTVTNFEDRGPLGSGSVGISRRLSFLSL